MPTPAGFASLTHGLRRLNSGLATLSPAGSTPEEKKESEANYEILRSLLINKTVVC
jgi:hypothetical protein